METMITIALIVLGILIYALGASFTLGFIDNRYGTMGLYWDIVAFWWIILSIMLIILLKDKIKFHITLKNTKIFRNLIKCLKYLIKCLGNINIFKKIYKLGERVSNKLEL